MTASGMSRHDAPSAAPGVRPPPAGSPGQPKRCAACNCSIVADASLQPVSWLHVVGLLHAVTNSALQPSIAWCTPLHCWRRCTFAWLQPEPLCTPPLRRSPVARQQQPARSEPAAPARISAHAEVPDAETSECGNFRMWKLPNACRRCGNFRMRKFPHVETS